MAEKVKVFAELVWGARAALNGLKLKDLITRYVAEGLEQSRRAEAGAGDLAPARPGRSDPPIIAKATPP